MKQDSVLGLLAPTIGLWMIYFWADLCLDYSSKGPASIVNRFCDWLIEYTEIGWAIVACLIFGPLFFLPMLVVCYEDELKRNAFSLPDSIALAAASALVIAFRVLQRLRRPQTA